MGNIAWLFRALALAGVVLAVPAARAWAQDEPVSLGANGALQSSDDAFPLTITGFGVGNYTYNGKTNDNTFAASKVAVGLFREINDNLYIYGQLTTLLEEDEATGEVVTSPEIDNLLFNINPSLGAGVSFAFGKADAPIGFERDDEVLNFLPSTSFNFELGRPAKFTGLIGRWTMSPSLDVTGIVANGWDSDIAPNHGKTGGVRVGVYPTDGAQFGISALYGSEGDVGATNHRYLLSLDYSVEPGRGWVVGGEANYGGDRGVLADGSDAQWGGATLIVFHQLRRHIGLAARAEIFDDPDGMRTGTPQTLESYSFSPMYLFGVGQNGIFANVEHTTFRIPRFQVRGEVRLNHSSVPVFDTTGAPSQWEVLYTLQLVTTF